MGPGYRIFVFKDGRITSAEELLAQDDMAALAEARQMRPDQDRELWTGGRLVASLPADN